MNKKDKIVDILKESITAKALILYDESLIAEIEAAANLISKTLSKGGRVLVCGNGGSAAYSQHFVAELVGRFQKERRALAAIALTTDTSILTAMGNDYGFESVFARQVEALGAPKDLLFAISTSGQAKNVLLAVKQAKKKGLAVVGLTGKGGGALARSCDISLIMPSGITARIQECHIAIIHTLCELVESSL